MSQRRSFKDLIGLIAVLLTILYPLGVYWGLQHLVPRLLSGIILIAALLRFGAGFLFDRTHLAKALPLLLAVVCSCLISMLLNDTTFLLYIPSFISLVFLVTIGQSLLWPPTFIETFAQRDFPVLPPSAIRYCRKVTFVWCGFLLFNAVMNAILATYAPHAWWALYSGLISYVLMGLVFLIEFLIRKKIEPRFAADLEAMNLPAPST